MEFDVYHDESKIAGYWHGILLVPRTKRDVLLRGLQTIRDFTGCKAPISLKDVNERRSHNFQCGRAWVRLGTLALIQNIKGKVEHVFVGKQTFSSLDHRTAVNPIPVLSVDQPIGCRFILFRERDDHRLMDPGGKHLDHGAKIETTFRMGLKGGLHYLFDENKPASVASLHFDGHKHLGRHVDGRRIVGRLEQELRSYCRFLDTTEIHDQSSDHTKPDAQPYEDCQLLQLTDLLVGSFRTVLGKEHSAVHAEVALPVKDLIQKWSEGPTRMKNSRWHKGFWLSEGHLEYGKWQFGNLRNNPRAAEEHPLLPL